jgi:hypothetical protein
MKASSRLLASMAVPTRPPIQGEIEMPRRKREITPTLPIEPLDPSQSVEQAKDVRHQLWLIYSQLKDAESDAAQRLELLECSREDLGRVLNEINRQDELFLASVNQKPKSPRYQAAISNCRARQFNLTADTSRFCLVVGERRQLSVVNLSCLRSAGEVVRALRSGQYLLLIDLRG